MLGQLAIVAIIFWSIRRENGLKPQGDSKTLSTKAQRTVKDGDGRHRKKNGRLVYSPSNFNSENNLERDPHSQRE
jgi:hypothetical protein